MKIFYLIAAKAIEAVLVHIFESVGEWLKTQHSKKTSKKIKDGVKDALSSKDPYLKNKKLEDNWGNLR